MKTSLPKSLKVTIPSLTHQDTFYQQTEKVACLEREREGERETKRATEAETGFYKLKGDKDVCW